MTKPNELNSLKTFAKRIARERRVPHHDALDMVAKHLKQMHWNALIVAHAKGWRPTTAALKTLASLCADAEVMAIPVLGLGQGVKRSGSINGHPYSLEIDFEVVMGGNGWSILLNHAPSEKPICETYDHRSDNPLRDPEFMEQALDVCTKAAVTLRKRIAADWPRRSTKPDADGGRNTRCQKGLRASGIASIAMRFCRECNWLRTCGIVRNAMRRR
jgi:hypothetical protein